MDSDGIHGSVVAWQWDWPCCRRIWPDGSRASLQIELAVELVLASRPASDIEALFPIRQQQRQFSGGGGQDSRPRCHAAMHDAALEGWAWVALRGRRAKQSIGLDGGQPFAGHENVAEAGSSTQQ